MYKDVLCGGYDCIYCIRRATGWVNIRTYIYISRKSNTKVERGRRFHRGEGFQL